MKSLISIVLLLFSVVCFSQCPDAKTTEYRNKLQQYGDHSYATLTQYYYHKCQCENGIGGRTPEQVNQLVDQYNHLKEHSKNQTGIAIEGRHKVQWITISKVSKCSSDSNANDSDNENNSLSKVKKQRKTFFDDVKKVFNEAGIDQNVADLINEGNYEDANWQIKENQLQNSLTEVFKGNSAIASTLASSLTSIAQGIEQQNREGGLKFVKDLLSLRELYQNNYKKLKELPSKQLHLSGFKDWNTTLENNDFNITKTDSVVMVEFIQVPDKKRMKTNDSYFLELNHPDINLAQDFKLSFDIVYETTEKKRKLPHLFSLYLSEVNKITLSPGFKSHRLSFTPLMNQYKNWPLIDYYNIPLKYDDLAPFFSKINLTKGHSLYYENVDKSEYKKTRKIIKKERKDFKELTEDNYVTTFNIVKVNDSLFVTSTFNNGEEKFEYLKFFNLKNIDFNLLKSNTIYFGPGSNYNPHTSFSYKSDTPGKDNETMKIKNIKYIQQ